MVAVLIAFIFGLFCIAISAAIFKRFSNRDN